METCQITEDWKKTWIIPIMKSNKNASSHKSYKPIYVTNYYFKLMENLTLEKITFYLDSNNLLPSEQNSFRRGYLTVAQIFI